MTTALPESINAPAPQGPQGPSNVQVEVADTPLPPGVRLDCLRLNGMRRARPRLSSLPSTNRVIPAVGVTVLTMLLKRNRRRA